MGKFYAIKYLFVYTLLVFTLLAISCTKQDRDHDGLADDSDQCPLIAAKTKNGCPITPKISKVHLYLDNSASMGGYFTDSTQYKTIVSDLTVKIEKEISPIDISFIADRTVKYPGGAQHFTADIATTQMADGNSSELHVMMNQIAARAKASDVSLLISDCILSFPDAAIKANREVNRTDAEGVLKNNIYSTFADLRKKGLGASIYAFQSRFTGWYYNYQNTRIRLKGNLRPFYVWVVAQKNILALFDAKMAAISSFKPEQALHFGMIDSAVSVYHILPQLGRQGHWKKIASPLTAGDKGLEDVEINKSEPVLFNAGVNLDRLPGYARELSYLKKNLQLSSSGCRATFTIRPKGEVNSDKVKSNDQRISYENATHIIEVRIDEIRLPSARIQLQLPLKYDTWYTAWSCMDDRQVKALNHQTFAFNYLIDGLKQAYETNNKNYIRLTFNLLKP